MTRFIIVTALLARSIAALASPAPGAIGKLAKAALACRFEDGAFADDCAAYKAWSDNEALFADGKGDEAIFAMLGDADVKVRVLAASKGIDDSAAYFADKGRAAKLFAITAKETDAGVGRKLAQIVTHVDADKLGLAKELRALAKQPLPEVRAALADVVVRFQSPTAIDVLQALLADQDRDVRESAISALSTGGMTPGVEPVCTLLTKQLQRTDDMVGQALWSGSSSKCAGMDKAVVAELAKRTVDPSKITNKVGVDFALAASGVCTRTKASELKQRGFAIGKSLVDRKVPDPNTRRAALDALVDCDRDKAAAVLTTLTKDPDSIVAKAATEKLGKLKMN